MLGPTLLTISYLNQENSASKPRMIIAVNKDSDRKKAKIFLIAVIMLWLLAVSLFVWTMIMSFTCPTTYRMVHPVVAFFFPIPYFIGAKIFGC